MSEVEVVVGQVVPVISAAVVAYGAAVLTRAQEAAADATATLGRRFWAILRSAPQSEPLESAVTDLAAAGGDDPDAVAALRLQVRKILERNPELVTELAGILPPAAQAGATGTRAVAIAGNNNAPISTGDNSPIWNAR
ncbi:hypothetical protein OG352_27650 [Streptomyces sp. NBC_01485]|uniref:hypothetical protein n=1 Tax=Streptomyces sp. NBC_01485 TaxID=2903884 RepID=UPI002E33DB58|nr:hypothetical protein [Streptomyces sp. NBC_01485]